MVWMWRLKTAMWSWSTNVNSWRLSFRTHEVLSSTLELASAPYEKFTLSLKWLCDSGQFCIYTVNLCSLMYRVVHGSAPTYLTELCQPCSDTRLRSTSRGDFIVPRFNRQLSNSSFSVAAPSAWNRLPSHIRTSSTYTLFLPRLKTHICWIIIVTLWCCCIFIVFLVPQSFGCGAP